MLVKIERWIIEKNLSENEISALQNNNEGFVEKETEKAYFVKFSTKFGTIKSWFPKNQCSEIKEVEKVITTEIIKSINGMMIETESGKNFLRPLLEKRGIEIKRGNNFEA